tara:strand:+ start:20495 stop:20812 length:318 start_codon:yes stop_codon:yes gene_type:complete
MNDILKNFQIIYEQDNDNVVAITVKKNQLFIYQKFSGSIKFFKFPIDSIIKIYRTSYKYNHVFFQVLNHHEEYIEVYSTEVSIKVVNACTDLIVKHSFNGAILDL